MKTYDIIFITNLPAFYKLNLFNRIAKFKKLMVVFTHEQHKQRNADFCIGERNFEYLSIANKNGWVKLACIHQLIKGAQYNQLILGGWDHYTLWFAAFLSPLVKNAVIVESSIHDSKIKGIKGRVKKIFLQRISKAYVSGKSQADLCMGLGFNGALVKTKGVGIFNLTPQPVFQPRDVVKNFIYVGRLSPEKNLAWLVTTFNELPNLRLTIVGYGPSENYLKSIAAENTSFLGAIPNRELYRIYQQNDVFILPSLSEPWGLVVEEALNNGLPVIVSDKVGCAQEIVNNTNGIIFNLDDPKGLNNAIIKMLDIDFYNTLRFNISRFDFEKIAEEQVKCYL